MYFVVSLGVQRLSSIFHSHLLSHHSYIFLSAPVTEPRSKFIFFLSFYRETFEYPSPTMSRYSITELLALQDTASIDIGQFAIYALES